MLIDVEYPVRGLREGDPEREGDPRVRGSPRAREPRARAARRYVARHFGPRRRRCRPGPAQHDALRRRAPRVVRVRGSHGAVRAVRPGCRGRGLRRRRERLPRLRLRDHVRHGRRGESQGGTGPEDLARRLAGPALEGALGPGQGDALRWRLGPRRHGRPAARGESSLPPRASSERPPRPSSQLPQRARSARACVRSCGHPARLRRMPCCAQAFQQFPPRASSARACVRTPSTLRVWCPGVPAVRRRGQLPAGAAAEGERRPLQGLRLRRVRQARRRGQGAAAAAEAQRTAAACSPMQPRQTLQTLQTRQTLHLQRLSCTLQTLQPRQPRQPRRPPPRTCCAQVVQQLLAPHRLHPDPDPTPDPDQVQQLLTLALTLTLTLTLPLTLSRCSSCSLTTSSCSAARPAPCT